LDWLNGVYIRQLPADELACWITPVLLDEGLEADPETVRAVTPLIQERIKTLNDAIALTDFFFTDPGSEPWQTSARTSEHGTGEGQFTYDASALIGKKMDADSSLEALHRTHATLGGLAVFDEETLETELRALADDLGLKAGQLFGVIRVAVTGKKIAPPLFGTLAVLGRERTLARIKLAEEKLAVSVQIKE
jgi:glutamyl-tRNA synthetase